MELKHFFLFLCTSLAAISASASSATCDSLERSEQSLNQTSIQLHDFETKVIKASNDGTPLPQDLSAPSTSDRDAARQKLSSALERLQNTIQMLNDTGSGQHSASLEKLGQQLQVFQAKLASKKVDQDASPSGHGTMDFGKLLRAIRSMQKFTYSVNKVMLATIKKKCDLGSLEARQDLGTILSDLDTLLTDLLDDLNVLLDTLGTLLTDLLENVSVILYEAIDTLISLLQSTIDAVSSMISSLFLSS